MTLVGKELKTLSTSVLKYDEGQLSKIFNVKLRLLAHLSRRLRGELLVYQ